MDGKIGNLKNYLLSINDNYLKETFLENLIINLLIILFTIAFCVSEIFYRKMIYEYSLAFQKNIQEEWPDFLLAFFRYITDIGGKYFVGFIVLFVFFFFSIIKSTVFIFGLELCVQLNYLMKGWYGDLRPYLEDNTLFQGKCEAGYGNPSSHSVVNTFLYLILFVYLRDTNILKNRYIIQAVILLFLILWIFLICLSRIVVGVHSIDQVIYGASLGFIIFLFFTVVFKLHKMPISYYKNFYNKKPYIITSLFIIIIIIAASFINRFILSKHIDIDLIKYNLIIDALCGEKYPYYKRFNDDCLYGSLFIIYILGGYLGQMIFWYLIDHNYKKDSNNSKREDAFEFPKSDKNNEIEFDAIKVNDEDNGSVNDSENDDSSYKGEQKDYEYEKRMIDELINIWYNNRKLFSSAPNMLLTLIIIIICCSPISLYLIIPNDTSRIKLFIFKIAVPFFSSLFFFYGFGFYFIIRLTCGPKEILLEQLNKFQKKNTKIFQ